MAIPKIQDFFAHDAQTRKIYPVVETGTDGTLIDPLAPAGVLVTSVDIERDGLRNGWLAIAASMGDEENSWAGVCVTRTGKWASRRRRDVPGMIAPGAAAEGAG